MRSDAELRLQRRMDAHLAAAERREEALHSAVRALRDANDQLRTSMVDLTQSLCEHHADVHVNC